MTFFKKFLRTLADLLTSKKAIATAAGVIATAAGHPDVGAAVAAYVLGQSIADHGKEAAKVAADTERWRSSDEALAAQLKLVKASLPPQS